MTRHAIAALAALALVAGCATVRDSRLNPFNWFGRSAETRAAAAAPRAAADPRRAVAQVTALAVEPTAGGAIVRATGLPPTQGHWDVSLVPEPAEDGSDELVYRMLVAPPPVPRPAGTPMSREVTAGVFLSAIRLEGIRRITVAGEANARTVTRR